MIWIKIDINEIPDVEVLAYGYQGNFIVGYLAIADDNSIYCESDGETLIDVTHYCFLIPPSTD